MKFTSPLISLLLLPLLSVNIAFAQSGLNNISSMQQSNADIEALVAEHDKRVNPAWLEVTSNPQGTLAVGSFHTEMLDLDFTAGADIGLVYYAPSANATSNLDQGFYTLRLQDDEKLGLAGLLIDSNGQVAQYSQAEVHMMSFSAQSTPVEDPAEVFARMNGAGEVIASAHGDCWLIGGGGSAHGRCWITVVPIDDIE